MDYIYENERKIALQISRMNKYRDDEEYIKKFRINKASEKEIILPSINESNDAKEAAMEIYQLILDEYCLTITDICNYLKVNRQWVEKYIKDDVTHIFLNITMRDFLMRIAYSNTGMLDYEAPELPVLKDYYYFSKEDFEKWVRSHIKREKQTIRVDFSQYVNANSLQMLEEKWNEEIFEIERQKKLEIEKKVAIEEVNEKNRYLFTEMLPRDYRKLWKLPNSNRMKRNDIPIELDNDYELPPIFPFFMNETYANRNAILQLKNVDFSQMDVETIYFTVLSAYKEANKRDEFTTLKEYKENYGFNTPEMVYRELYSSGAVRYTIEAGEKGNKILYFNPHDPELNLNDGEHFPERYSKVVSYEKYLQIIKR